jgi:hypothetical protein
MEMNLYKPNKIIFIVIFSATMSFADAFPSTYQWWGGLSVSFENLVAFEGTFKERSAFLLWGGPAGIYSILTAEFPIGIEGAFELRVYSRKRKNTGICFSFYHGVSYAFYDLYNKTNDYSFFATTAGVKFTYKKNLFSRVVFEPYISCSHSLYFSENIDRVMANPFPLVTLGLRFVWFHYEKHLNK